ncbi:MAG: tyrosine-type recombinase/integrase [Thermomicrobium sp.]|nr:site-specific integrase [Thermomicrobium sp.]MDW8007394.1 tyrosine-type recombinase/integrase [Thermomicrobium sp.]
MVTIRKRHDGRYEARVQRDGRRYSVYGHSVADVQRKLAELERSLSLDQPPPPGTLTLGELVERWLATERRRWKPRTLANYQRLYQRHVAPVLGPVRLSRLTPDRLQRFLDQLPGERTPDQVFRLLHRCFRWGTRLGLVATNPADRVTPPVYRPPRPRLPDSETIRRLYQHCLEADDAGAPLVAFLLASGCRIGEALALRWSDIDWQQRTVRIERSGQWIGGEWVETPPKTAAGVRTLPLGDTALVALQKQRRLVAERRLRAGPAWQPHDLVFPGTHGQPLQLRTVQDALARLCRAAGVPVLTPHQCRHAHASLLLAAGASIADIQHRLGHATPSVTLGIYAHALNDGRAVAERLEQLLG